MKVELRDENGNIVLDAASRLLRVVAKVTGSISNTGGVSDMWDNTTGEQRKRFYSISSTTTIEGTKPTVPTYPSYLTLPTYDQLSVFSGVDNCTYWDTLQGMFGDVVNAAWYESFPTESWANSLPTKYGDYFKVSDDKGKLMWSTGTLGDSLIRVARYKVNSLNSVHTVTSPNNRRLHIMLTDSFKSGTYTEDEGGSTWSASGLQMRWSNNGRTIKFSYASFYDGDISNFFNNGGEVTLTFFERYDD